MQFSILVKRIDVEQFEMNSMDGALQVNSKWKFERRVRKENSKEFFSKRFANFDLLVINYSRQTIRRKRSLSRTRLNLTEQTIEQTRKHLGDGNLLESKDRNHSKSRKSENLNLLVTRFLNELDIEKSEFEKGTSKELAGARLQLAD